MNENKRIALEQHRMSLLRIHPKQKQMESYVQKIGKDMIRKMCLEFQWNAFFHDAWQYTGWVKRYDEVLRQKQRDWEKENAHR